MFTGNSRGWLGVFFCSLGLVCSGPALGAEGDGQAVPGAPIDPPALFETVSDDEQLPQGQQVEVGSLGQIDLHVKDLDLTKVLQLLSIQSQRNIIASRNVAGAISADLYGVDFYEAMDAILHTNGFGYREQGQFIYVYTSEEIAQLEDENRQLAFEIVRLNYLNATDASAFVSPLLSANGSIALSGEPDDGFEPSLSDGGANQSAHQDTLVIRDYAENIEVILGVIERLDTRPKQVLVEATILQARLTELNAFGVDFSIFADLNLTDFTTPLGAVDELITGSGPGGPFNSGSAGTSTAGKTVAGAHSVKVGFVGNDAAVFVRALDSVTDTTVLARPSVLVLNRQSTNLLVGQRLGYLSTTATETSNTQTVEFLDVGTQLTLRPFISDDDFVRMELRPSVSDGSTSLVGGFVIPDTTTQELTTNVIVRSGQTIVLGGLFKEDTTIGRTSVPGLGGLPVVGAAFKGQDDDVKRSEVIFMIKPTVIKDEALTQMADSAGKDIDSTRLGMREGLLPWSRSKLTSAYVRDAIQYMKDGNNDKALWSLDKALYMDPTMADARRLREEITGKKVYFYDRSILKQAVDSAIDAELMTESQGSEDAQPKAQAEDGSFDDLSVDEIDFDASQAQPETGVDAGDWNSDETSAQWQSETQDQSVSTDDFASEFIDDLADEAGPADTFEFAAESAEWTEPADDFANEFTEDQAAEASAAQPESASAWESDSADQGDDQPAAEAPWQIELTGVDDAEDFSADDAFGDSASVEVIDPDQLFADEQAQQSANEPVSIFEFVESETGADTEAEAEADADADTETADAGESEAAVSSVDTDEQTE